MKKFKTNLLYILTSILITSCSNEPFDQLTIEKIEANSELFNSLKNISENQTDGKEQVCITFVYPFNVYLYDNDSIVVDSRIIGNNREFIEVLEATNQEGAIGLSYPISSILENGDTITIQNNTELKEVIKACIESEIINYCNGLLEEQNCVWKITSLTENKNYNKSLLDFYQDGTGVFYDKGTAHRTSWISLFIEEKLHVNIHLEGTSETAQDWNFNWKAIIIDENTIEISNENDKYLIQKECNVENSCDYVEFRECQTEASEEISEFIFENYKDCIISLQENVTNPLDVSLTFFETYQNALQEINILNSSSYQNTSNPQVIFVNIKNTNTDESNLIRIVLYVDPCII